MKYDSRSSMLCIACYRSGCQLICGCHLGLGPMRDGDRAKEDKKSR